MTCMENMRIEERGTKNEMRCDCQQGTNARLERTILNPTLSSNQADGVNHRCV
ncbi:hypothetical protein BT69DRAFT_1281644 [Atractiella rhizophila]|nr:hypothetical protein BT69DRAFT_1281644 [Atractiella rhizophila]